MSLLTDEGGRTLIGPAWEEMGDECPASGAAAPSPAPWGWASTCTLTHTYTYGGSSALRDPLLQTEPRAREPPSPAPLLSAACFPYHLPRPALITCSIPLTALVKVACLGRILWRTRVQALQGRNSGTRGTSAEPSSGPSPLFRL